MVWLNICLFLQFRSNTYPKRYNKMASTENTAQEGSIAQKYTTKVKGIDFNQDIDLETLIGSLGAMGGQGTTVSEAIRVLNKVLELRTNEDPNQRPFIFLGYTSNMVSCGVREILTFIAKNGLVDAFISTAGGVEEDIMKTRETSYVMDYLVNDRKWRTEGKNRIGNMVVSNDAYDYFEEFFLTVLERLQKKQVEEGVYQTPSSLIREFGKEVNKEESLYYQAYKNDIPVFSPGLIDGAIGDVLCFRGIKDDTFVLDVNADLTKIVDLTKEAREAGRPLVGLFLGGGSIKYHALNAAKMAGGLDYGVFMTVGSPFDGSNSGALPSQDVSRGAIKPDAETVLVTGEVSLIFPMIAAATFMKHEKKTQEQL